MDIGIYNGSTLVDTIKSVMDATYHESLNGELTFEFETTVDRLPNVSNSYQVVIDGKYFDIVRIEKYISQRFMKIKVTCEHVSYRLNNDAYKLAEDMDVTGSPSSILATLLNGTDFTVGTIEISSEVHLIMTSGSTRRAAVMQLIGLSNGEIDYSGYTISIKTHKGSTATINLMVGTAGYVQNIGYTVDSRAATTTYEIELFKLISLGVGDNVSINFAPLEINETSRVIEMEYNPNYRYSAKITVGQYKPDILDVQSNTQDTLDDTVTTVNNQGETITEVQTQVESWLADWDSLVITDTGFTVTIGGIDYVYTTQKDTSGRITQVNSSGKSRTVTYS